MTRLRGWGIVGLQDSNGSQVLTLNGTQVLMTFAKYGLSTVSVLGLIPYKQSLRDLGAYDL